jgi:hypothetical protein
MIEPVYVPYEQYRAAKTRCGLDSGADYIREYIMQQSEYLKGEDHLQDQETCRPYTYF